MKKRSKKIFIIIMSVLLIILIIILIFYIRKQIKFKEYKEYMSTFDDPVEDEARNEIKTTYNEIYSEKWNYSGFYIEDAEHTPNFNESAMSSRICAEFTLINENDHLDDSLLENMSEICNMVLSVTDKYLSEDYSSYPITIFFEETNYDLDDSGIISITYTNNGLTSQMYLQNSYATVKNIANTFPEINRLSASVFHYDNIEDFKEFSDLQKIEIRKDNYTFTNEEKEYILSIFPECEIDDYLSSYDDPDEDNARAEFKETYQEVYNEKWIYNYFSIVDSEHSPDFDSEIQESAIEVSFTLKNENDILDDSMLENISEICEAVHSIVNEYLYDEYSLYPIKIYFKTNDYSIESDSMIIITYSAAYTAVTDIYLKNSTVTVKKIASLFPSASQLEASRFYYDSMEDFNGFNWLWKLEILNQRCALTDEEKEYILSLYPGCEIVD